MSKVIRRPDESLDDLYKRFKSVVKRDGILLELKMHKYYLNKRLKQELKAKLTRRKRIR